MAKPRQGLHAFYRLTISLMVVVVPFLLYFYFYFQSRYDYFVSRNFRTLNDVGTQLTSLMEQFGPLFAFSPLDVDTRTLEEQVKLTDIELDRRWLKRLSDTSKDQLDADWKAYRKSEEKKDDSNQAKKQLNATLRILRETKRAARAQANQQQAQTEQDSQGAGVETDLWRQAEKLKQLTADAKKKDELSKDDADTSGLKSLLQNQSIRAARQRLTKEKNYLVALHKTAAYRHIQMNPVSSDAENPCPSGEEEIRFKLNRAKVATELTVIDCRPPERRSSDEDFQFSTTDVKFGPQFDKKLFLDTLLEQFKNNGILLSKGVDVDNTNNNNESQITNRWTITDRDNKQTYTIEQNEDRLDIYKKNGPNLEAHLPVADLIDTDAVLKNFNHFLLAQEDGVVIYGSGPAFTRFENLQHFLLDDKPRAGTESDHSTNGGQSNDSSNRENNRSGKPAGTGSAVVETKIGESSYLLFLQPIALPLHEFGTPPSATGDLPIWYLCGVVSKSRFRADVLTVPLTISGLVILGLVLGILAWPYLKVRSINPNERLRPADVYFLTASLILGTALVTLLLLDSIAYRGLRERFDNTARRISDDILNRFDAELRETINHLHGVATQIHILLSDSLKSGLINPSRQCWEDEANNVRRWSKAKEGVNNLNPWPKENEYPAFEVAYLLNKEGSQVGPQMSRRSLEPPAIRVPDRSYFLTARDGPVWHYGQDRQPFFIERINTYDQGWTLSALSIPFESLLNMGLESGEQLQAVSGQFDQQKEFPLALRQEFENHGISLSATVPISVWAKNSQWLITNQATGTQYDITQEQDQLNIRPAVVKSLFSTGPEFKEQLQAVSGQLDQQKFPQALRQEFENHGIGPSEHVTVSVVAENRWLMTDNKTQYGITQEQGQLNSQLNISSVLFESPHRLLGDQGVCEPRVAVLVKRFQSFWATVLPPSFGFAVIEDASGKVMFHSDDSRSLMENFFSETDGNPTLKAAVQMRHHDFIAGQYNGVAHHFYITPVRDIPWSLVVFYDEGLVQTVNFELALTVAVHLILYTGLFMLGIVLIHLFVPDPHWAWLWPQWEREAQYGHIARLLVLVGLYYAFGLWFLDGWWLVLLILGVSLFVLGLLFLVFQCRVAVQGGRRCIAWTVLTVGAVSNAVALCGLSRNVWTVGLGILLVSIIALYSRFILLQSVSGPPAKRGEPTLGFRVRYLSVACMSVLILSVLPSVAIFKDAFRVHTTRLTKFGQLTIAHALEARTQVIQSDAARLKPETYERAGAEQVQLAVSARCRGIYFDSAPDCEDGGPHSGITSAEAFGNAEPRWDWSYKLYNCPETDTHSDSNVCVIPQVCTEGKMSSSCDDLATEWIRIAKRDFTAWLALFFPAYNSLAGELHDAIYEVASDEHWGWQDCRDPAALCGNEERDSMVFYLKGKNGTPKYRLKSTMLPIVPVSGLGDWLLVVFSFGVLMGGPFLLVRFLAVRVLGLDLPDFEILGQDDRPAEEWIKESRVLVRPPSETVDQIERRIRDKVGAEKLWTTDLLLPTKENLKGLGLRSTDLADRDIFIVKNFESGLTDPQLRRSLLEFLEDLAFRQKTILICSSVSSLYDLFTLGAYPEMGHVTLSADEAFRWNVLLLGFRKERFRTTNSNPDWPDWKKTTDPLEATLIRECRWSQDLWPIKAFIENEVAYKDGRLTEEQIIKQVGDLAEMYYRKLWMFCTKEERLALIYLAEGNLLNPRNVEVIERLRQDGLIRRDPDFQLANQSFARFVSTAETGERIAEWEQETPESLWSVLRLPLLIMLLLVGVFVAYTGGEAFDATAGVIPAAVAGLPVLIQVLNFFRGGKSAASDDN